MPIEEAVEKLIEVIKSVVDNLPDHEPTLDMQALGKNVNDLKAYLSDGPFDCILSPDKLVEHVTNVNTRIHTVTSNLLRQLFHPEIISNVLFGYWLRISALHACMLEEYYQKMEFYFSEIIAAARKQVPMLFKQPR